MIPHKLIHTLTNATGFDEDYFIQSHNIQAPTSVRINLKKAITDFDNQQQIAWCKHAYNLDVRPSFTYSPLFHAGCYYVQEASSMFLHHVVKHISSIKKIDTALDLCAAPGGKSTLLLDALDDDSLLVSNELVNSRVTVLIENINKWGRTNTVVTNNDAKKFASLAGMFDLIVVDAPCSGSGLFRKDKEAIKEWSLENVEMCSIRQQKILVDVMPALSNDGYLIYSTCSYSIDENETICDYLIDTFDLETVQIPIEKVWGVVESKSKQHNAFGYRFYPDKVIGEGFFIAVFKSNSDCSKKYFKKQSNYITTNTKKFEQFVDLENNKMIISRNGFNCCINKHDYDKIEQLTSQLNIKKVGVDVGEIMRDDVIPSHALALSMLVKKTIHKVELDEESAIKYLKREGILVSENKLGWALASYKGFALGWMKILPNRINNYYPKSSRILH